MLNINYFRIYAALVAILVMLVANDLKGQRFKGAIMGGMNISQVDGDEVYGYHRIGGHLAAAAILPIKKWDITLEVAFNQKGAYQKPQYNGDSITGEYNLRLNYVEIPLTFHYTDREFISAGAGFSYGALVKTEEIEHGGLQPPYSETAPFKNYDINLLADVQIRIWRRLKFNVRFAYSLVPIREREFENLNGDTWMRKQYNHLWTFRLVYVFNERISRQPMAE